MKKEFNETKRIPNKINTFYTLGEEIFNSVSHGIGVLFGVAALVLIVVCAVLYGNAWGVVSGTIYGSTMIIMYTMSTLYHSFQLPSVKKVFRIFDHCSIYLLIAGTYTPYTLVTLRGPLGWTMFGIVWGAAILGVVLNSINLSKFRIFSMICYIAMGWVIIFATKPLLASLEKGGVFFLYLGGVFYMAGIAFYVAKKLPYAHSLWHLFVVAGSLMHFFSILFYVIPINN